ncbi:hypothetical protein BGZ57DRAFT_734513, partial [Hyaloscypha finlandica]
GHGQHCNYFSGWKGDSLQRAMIARCNNEAFSEIPSQSPAAAIYCTIEQTMNGDVDGY